MASNWTAEEDQLLKDLYETAPREEILAKLPGKAWRQCYRHSIILGLFRPKDDAWKKEELDLLKELYPNTPKDILITKLPGRSWKGLSWQAINTLRLIRSKEIVQAETRKTNRERFGADYHTQTQAGLNKVKKSVQEHFGVDNVFQAEEIKKEIKKTNKEKFGVENPQQCPKIREQARQTNQERYGVDNPFQLTDRVQAGMLKKHGVTIPLKSPAIKAKQQATNIERYGVPVPAQNEIIQNKIEETNLTRFGFKTPLQNDIVKQKIVKTNLEKYGVTNPAKLEEIKEKIKKTNLEKFGVESLLQLKEIRAKGFAVMKKNKSFNKSKEELKFWEFLKEFDPETEHHVEHPELHHIIDFYLPKFNLWVQYDGTYWHGKVKRINVTRQALKILKTMDRDKLQNENIPNLIRFWSDDVHNAIENKTILNLIDITIKGKINKNEICHQYIKKLEWLEKDLETLSFNSQNLSASDFILNQEEINPEIIEFIQKYEWLGNIGVYPKWCFTARYRNILGGVVLINEPTAYSKIIGPDTSIYEALIQRGATASWSPKNLGSRLIMFSCNWMVKNTTKRAFTAYADPEACELGIIYQACGFDYLGNNFGNSFLYKHPNIKNNNPFSSQTLKRTSSFKKWCKNNNIKIQKIWFKENEFKNLDMIPEEIKNRWYIYNKQILDSAEKITIEKKHKYILIKGKTKKENKFLNNLKNYKIYPYPKK